MVASYEPNFKYTRIMKQSLLIRRDWIALLWPVLIGCCCVGLWWLERFWRLGWSSSDWLRESWWSIYGITALVVGVFLAPLYRAWRIPIPWLLAYVVLLYGGSWGGYQVARSIFYTLYTQGLMGGEMMIVTVSIWKLFGLVVVLAMVYFVPLWQFHHSTDRLHILTLVEAFVAVVPCSLISLAWLPLTYGEESFIQAVYWGYPFFWMPVLLGWVAVATTKEWI